MDNKDLHQALKQVSEEVDKTENVDDKGRQLLQDLDGHVRQLLEEPEEAAKQPRPEMKSGLEEAIRHFEVTHPALTAALSDLLTALSNAGI